MVPKEYEDSGKSEKRYPLIIALDGVSEQGTDINLLLHRALLQAILLMDGTQDLSTLLMGNFISSSFLLLNAPYQTVGAGAAQHIKTMLSI
jgi:hypothetical protein